ncbi:hypothetical protein M3P05_16675 [Sansalvadorimonas sp. 2012CJ34-2]|uniref:Uncharacterized protein n=1 Tax=Parendozoicomonas callyspongiae TaxID=2942213 RepID=A0ABT0PLE0_9GAMM|nr:inositol phosphate phosphatase SopB [Sansalvadorimonas sp. 2012CJ34-2]MCL6271552.1 hypothetical protein [Sansalvadorimonas sp. 2012CJ34-2]
MAGNVGGSGRPGGVETSLPTSHTAQPAAKSSRRFGIGRIISILTKPFRRTPKPDSQVTPKQTALLERKASISGPTSFIKPAPPKHASLPKDAVKLPGMESKAPEKETAENVSRVKIPDNLPTPKAQSTHDHHELLKLQTLHYNSAIEVLDKTLSGTRHSGQKLEDLVLMKGEMEHGLKMLQETAFVKGQEPVTKQEMKYAKEGFPEHLQERLVAAGVDPETVALKFKEAYVQQLNSREWGTVRSAFNHEGKAMSSTQKPAAQMQIPSDLKDQVKGLFVDEYNGHGVCCVDNKNIHHATNLWKSSFSVGGGAGYVGIRHGIADPYGVKDKDEAGTRAEGARKKAEEVLLAALGAKPDVLRRALAAADGKAEPPTLHTTSVSLVTTGAGSGKERKMQKAQNEAFEYFTSQQPVVLHVLGADGKPREVKLNIQQSRFNIPVNWGGVGPASLITGGRGLQKEMNDKAIAELVGKPSTNEVGGLAHQHLMELGKEIRDLRQQVAEATDAGAFQEAYRLDAQLAQATKNYCSVLDLSQQIQDIYRKGKHHHHHHDAYKLAARVSLLTSLIGGVPLSNCKSGKDRTGMLDAEIKFLAARIDSETGAVPKPGRITSDSDKELFRQILLNSGNLEVQEYNVGVRGYKTEGVASITERIGDDTVRQEVRGLSKTVGS